MGRFLPAKPPYLLRLNPTSLSWLSPFTLFLSVSNFSIISSRNPPFLSPQNLFVYFVSDRQKLSAETASITPNHQMMTHQKHPKTPLMESRSSSKYTVKLPKLGRFKKMTSRLTSPLTSPPSLTSRTHP